jgi:hypothetical protein
MFWHSKQPKKRPKSPRSKSQRHGAAHLFRFEHLESRHMLSGVVNVVTDAAGNLTLNGDGQGDSISLLPGAAPGQYTINGNGTLLTLNNPGGLATTSSLSVNGINGLLDVNLGFGGTFTLGQTGTAPATLPNVLGGVTIINGGNATNTVTNVKIDGNLTVTATNLASTNGANLALTGIQVDGDTVVNNTGGAGLAVGAAGGNSVTTITNSTLIGTGLPASTAFALINQNGSAGLSVQGTTNFGAGNNTPVIINNVNAVGGGSNINFAGTAAAPVTLYGRLQIANGNSLAGQIDNVSFNWTTVLGTVAINNAAGGGNTAASVTSSNSNLEAQLAPVAPPLPPASIANGIGFDTLQVTGSTLPWGLTVANDNAVLGVASANPWGSNTIIGPSAGGTPSVIGSMVAAGANALQITGDAGPNVVNVSSSNIGGAGGVLNLSSLSNAAGGNNSVTLSNNQIGALNAVLDGNANFLEIAGGTIQTAINVNLGAGGSTLYLANGSSSNAPVLPNPLFGAVLINGGLGVNTFEYETGVAVPQTNLLGFQLFVRTP